VLKVGQTLWRQSVAIYGNSGPVTVTKVGRKWATLSTCEKVDLKTLRVYSDSNDWLSAATLWQSREEYNRALSLDATWDTFTWELQRLCRPAHVTQELLEMVSALLLYGIEQ